MEQMKHIEHIFRAYDIRGIFNRELTAETATRIGLAFGTFLGGSGKVLVARDPRTSSEIIERAFISGLASTGCECFSTGLVPIPTANFKTWRGKFDAGAYITASHNPPEYNGVRFRHPDGSGYTTQNDEIRDIFMNGDFKLRDWDSLGDINYINPKETIREYSDFLKVKTNISKKLDIVLDTGNGASCFTAPQIFGDLGCNVTVINQRADGHFPGRPSEPSDKTLGELKSRVVKDGSDFGAGFDGDGDRVIFVDDKGRAVQTEKIGIMISKEILKHKKGNIIANVECSMIVEREIERLGGTVKRVRVGDVFVCEAIKEHGALFAMETSAHYFMPGYYIFDDPVLVCLKLAEILSKEDRKLSELADEIPSYPRTAEKFDCPDEIKFKVVDRIIEAFKSNGYNLDLTDGARLVFDDGWALIRPSNTTPLLRVTAEAETQERLNGLLDIVRKEFEDAMKAVY